MGLEDFLPLTGDSYGMADGHVYLKRRDTMEPYVWGGSCMRIDEQTIALRKMSVTTQQAIGGGIERHQARQDPPGESTFTLEMKRTQASRFKTLMRTCFWNIDHRIHCGGARRDAWNEWEEITRFCVASADERRMSGSHWEDTGSDMMTTFPMTALDAVDIYRVTGEGAAAEIHMEVALSFTNAAPDTITTVVAGVDFRDWFEVGDVIHVTGATSAANNGNHTIAVIVAQQIDLNAGGVLVTEGPFDCVLGGPLHAIVHDVDVCHGARCPTKCNEQQDCKIAAVTKLAVNGAGGTPSPWLMTSLDGGDLDTWASTELTEWVGEDADFVLCLSDFLILGSRSMFQILRSDDFGVTRRAIVATNDPTPLTWDATNTPRQIDGIDQCYILMCGDSGYMYRSVDAGRRWETVDAGAATTQDLNRVMIARDNPQVAYAIGQSNAFIKTENGGETWLDVGGPSAADNLFGLWVISAYHILVLNDDAELWESIDGGISWTMQETPPGMTIGDGVLTFGDIVGCGCDELYLTASSATEFLVYRNVYGGAAGFWYARGTEHWEALADDVHCIACCGPNRAIAAGGITTGGAADDGYFYLLA